MNVRWPGALESAVTLELFDVAGRCALREGYRARPDATHAVNVGALRPGSYVLRLTWPGGVFSGPLIIQR